MVYCFGSSEIEKLHTMELNAMLLQNVADRIGFDGSMTSSLDDGMAVDGLRYFSMDDRMRGEVQWLMEKGMFW